MKMTVLLHGPWANNCIGKILNEIENAPVDYYKHELEIVIVSYKADRERLNELLKETGVHIPLRIVLVRDLFNPGFYNINRQIMSVRTGLEQIDADRLVIKLRNDQSVSFRKLFFILRRIHYFRDGTRRFLTTNCYSRKDRLYHPSDMFLAALREDLLEYYSAPLLEDTAAESKMKLLEVIETDHKSFQKVFRSPESYLFSTYLLRKGWNIKNTQKDSFRAIDHFFYIVNSWDLDYRWNKIKLPQRKKGEIVLPMYGFAAPFGWDTPIRDENGNRFFEQICCYEKSDFTGKRTKKDAYYVALGKKLYAKIFTANP